MHPNLRDYVMMLKSMPVLWRWSTAYTKAKRLEREIESQKRYALDHPLLQDEISVEIKRLEEERECWLAKAQSIRETFPKAEGMSTTS